MSDDRKDLPSVTSDNFLQRVREAVQTYLGSQGDLLDRGVTLRDLSDAGLIDISKTYRVTRRGAPVAGPGPAVGAGGGTGTPGEAYTPDLTPPPTPDGFTVGAGISYLFIGCAPALYTQGHGHMSTRVYGATRASGAPVPVFADTVVLTEFQGTVFAHATNPATTWHLWITWVTRDGVESPTPAGGTNGLSVTTGQDVSSLLDALTGQITQSQLYSDLGDRIELIDGNGAGSVNARLAVESAARSNLESTVTSQGNTLTAQATAITTLQSQVATGADDTTALSAALSTEASTRATQTGALYAKYTVKVDVAGLISGYGLASTANNAAPTSSFGVRANAFFVAPPAVASATAPTTDLYDGYVWLDTSVVPNVTRYRSGSSWVLNAPVLPFVVQATPTTVNGVEVPAGVYANDLFVKNGTITNAKIANLAVDDAKIATLSVSKLTAGSLSAGQYVQSTNYVPNVSGWQWRADGSAELGSQYIRGKLTASQIDTRGLDIMDASGNVILSSGTSLKSQIAGNLPGGVTSNLLDTSGWVINQHGGAPGFQPNGGVLEQYRRAETLPDGSTGTTWFCYPGLYYNNAYGWDNPNPEGVPAGDADGGWNTDTFPINNNRGYRFAVWLRREGGGVGNVYLGCQDGTVYDMPGTAINTNPYFVVVPLANLVVGRWYLAVGYIYPTSESAAGQRGQSGLYDGTTGQKVHGGTDFTWAAGATTGLHRAYLYYSAAGSHVEFVWPRVEMTTGAEPSLAELLSMGAVSGRNRIDGSNISTYIADLAVNTLQLAGNAVTVPIWTQTFGSTYNAHSQNTIASLSYSTTVVPDGTPMLVTATLAISGSSAPGRVDLFLRSGSGVLNNGWWQDVDVGVEQTVTVTSVVTANAGSVIVGSTSSGTAGVTFSVGFVTLSAVAAKR